MAKFDLNNLAANHRVDLSLSPAETPEVKQNAGDSAVHFRPPVLIRRRSETSRGLRRSFDSLPALETALSHIR